MISASNHKKIIVHNLFTRQYQFKLLGHTKGVKCLKVINDKNLLISGSYDMTIRAWN